MSKDQVQDTTFDCKLCGQKIIFNVNDPTSYLSFADEKKFAGMTLSTYRVTHRSGQENHTNAVTVDHKGHWRGLVDAYVDYDIKKKASEFHFLYENNRALKISNTFEFLIIVNLSDGWVVDIVCPPRLLPLKISDSILQNLDFIESDLLEDSMLMKLDIAIGEKTFQTFLLGDISIVYILKNNDKSSVVQDFFDGMFASPSIHDTEKLNPNALRTIIQIIDLFPMGSLQVYNLIRVLEEGAINNPLKIRDPGKIPQLVKSVINQKSYPEYLAIALISLLSGQKTLVELIEVGFLKDFQQIFEIMDFVKAKI